MGQEVARKYLAHFIDVNFGTGTASYKRLGRDLEEYNVEASQSLTTIRNIIGETRIKSSGFEKTGQVDPYYMEYDDALTTKLNELFNTNATGDACRTTVVDELLIPPVTEGGTPTVSWAYKSTVYVAVDSQGGNTDGAQIPFTIHYEGEPEAVTWNPASNTITPATP